MFSATPSYSHIVWSVINMDFIETFLDVFCVIVDKLSEYGHFLFLAHPYTAHSLAQIFMDSIFSL